LKDAIWRIGLSRESPRRNLPYNNDQEQGAAYATGLRTASFRMVNTSNSPSADTKKIIILDARSGSRDMRARRDRPEAVLAHLQSGCFAGDPCEDRHWAFGAFNQLIPS
jgi:hypothetical protein